MPPMQRFRSNGYDGKSDTLIRASNLLAEDKRSSSRCANSHPRYGCRPSSYFNSAIGTCHDESVKYEKQGTSSTSLTSSNILGDLSSATKSVSRGSSYESGSDCDADVSGLHAINHLPDWGNSASSSVYELCRSKGDVLGGKAGGSIRHKGQDDWPLSLQDRCMPRSSRFHGSMSKNLFVDQGRPPQGMLNTGPLPQSLRKGSSSKSPQSDDITAALLLDKKARSIADHVLQGKTSGHVMVAPPTSKKRNACNVSRRASQSSAKAGDMHRRTNSSHAYNGHWIRKEDAGPGHREWAKSRVGSSRRCLGNLVCSSAADFLPSVSISALSNFACSSTTDVLPAVPSSFAGATLHFRPRKSSRESNSLEEGEAIGVDSRRQAENDGTCGSGEATDCRTELSHDPTYQGPGHRGARSMRPSFSHQRRLDYMKAKSVTLDTLPSSTGIQSPLPNYRHPGRNRALGRSAEGLRSVSRATKSESNSAFGDELPDEWSLRRRSLYRGQADVIGSGDRMSGRNLFYARPSSNTWSAIRDTHYPQSSFSCLPTRPQLAAYAEPSAVLGVLPFQSATVSSDFTHSFRTGNLSISTQNDEGRTLAIPEAGLFNPSASIGEIRPGLTAEGLSEIVSVLDYIERDEDVSYEQFLMLEATLLLGGIGLQDCYRDMRIDIDNMSYEELLALEERIGSVNTGLSEEKVVKCVRSESFTAPKVNFGNVPQEIEIKCSICQEEFEHAAELGVLECGHSHHIACIKQWLLQKNQCPICKAPAVM